MIKYLRKGPWTSPHLKINLQEGRVRICRIDELGEVNPRDLWMTMVGEVIVIIEKEHPHQSVNSKVPCAFAHI